MFHPTFFHTVLAWFFSTFLYWICVLETLNQFFTSIFPDTKTNIGWVDQAKIEKLYYSVDRKKKLRLSQLTIDCYSVFVFTGLLSSVSSMVFHGRHITFNYLKIYSCNHEIFPIDHYISDIIAVQIKSMDGSLIEHEPALFRHILVSKLYWNCLIWIDVSFIWRENSPIHVYIKTIGKNSIVDDDIPQFNMAVRTRVRQFACTIHITHPSGTRKRCYTWTTFSWSSYKVRDIDINMLEWINMCPRKTTRSRLFKLPLNIIFRWKMNLHYNPSLIMRKKICI